MPLTQKEKGAVRRSIARVLREHAASPFATLREAGVAAELRAELLSTPPFGQLVTAGTARHRANSDVSQRYRLRSGSPQTKRVQLEMTLEVSVRRCSMRKVVDLALFTRSPTLNWAANGPGDVVQQVPLQSVAAAIEIKASPSLDTDQRGQYVNDILWLLALKKSPENVDGFFVLLDKSSLIYGDWCRSPSHGRQAIRWDQRIPQDIAVRNGPFLATKMYGSLGHCGLNIAPRPLAHNRCFVEVWALDSFGRPNSWAVW